MEERSEQEKLDEFNKLKENNFKQQKLSAWRPVPTITSTTVTFVVFGIVFLILGIVILTYSNQIQEQSIQYDTNCPIQSANVTKPCNLTFSITSTFTGTVMVYYQLNNFYQNHRRYVKSKSNTQLYGGDPTTSYSTDCDPIVTVGNLGFNKVLNGSTLPDSAPANPCGLIAKSLFNDTYNITNGTNNSNYIFINETNIAWASDKSLKYAYPKDYKSYQWTDIMNEHFMVWMRPAGLPNFRKLWGRINGDLSPGNYTLLINNNYDVSSFNGSKSFVLSTVNSFGGKNSFLGISYIVVGSICIVMAILFVVGYKIHNNNNQKKTF